jgi:hypothetical protein
MTKMLSALSCRLRRLGAAMTSRHRDAVIRRGLAQEFAGLGCDLDRVLADIGCSRDDLAAIIANAPRSRPLLDAMILRLDLEKEFAFADPRLLRHIERCCATCPTQAVCSRWLSTRGAPDEYRLFCPNAGNFALLTKAAAA